MFELHYIEEKFS